MRKTQLQEVQVTTQQHPLTYCVSEPSSLSSKPFGTNNSIARPGGGGEEAYQSTTRFSYLLCQYDLLSSKATYFPFSTVLRDWRGGEAYQLPHIQIQKSSSFIAV